MMQGRTGLFEARSITIPDIVMLMRAELEADPITGQTICQERIYELAKTCVLDKKNYAWVSIREGIVVASLCALVTDQPVYERKMAAVMQFYTTEAGEDEKLLHHFLEWARGQRKIKRIVAMLEDSASPRVGDLLVRMGLTESMAVYSQWR